MVTHSQKERAKKAFRLYINGRKKGLTAEQASSSLDDDERKLLRKYLKRAKSIEVSKRRAKLAKTLERKRGMKQRDALRLADSIIRNEKEGTEE